VTVVKKQTEFDVTESLLLSFSFISSVSHSTFYSSLLFYLSHSVSYHTSHLSLAQYFVRISLTTFVAQGREKAINASCTCT
jgi:hypothetical protein